MIRWLSACALASVVCLSSSLHAVAAELPLGTFTASPQRDWAIKFEEKGKYSIVRGGQTVVEGAYEATETELTLTDEKGPLANQDEGAKTGKYTWKLDDGVLTFELVEANSKGRELTLTLNKWAEKQ